MVGLSGWIFRKREGSIFSAFILYFHDYGVEFVGEEYV
jgi:hypothetical protein